MRGTLEETAVPIRAVLPIGIVALAWEMLPLAGIVSAVFLPPLHEVLITLFELLVTLQLVDVIAISLGRGFTSYFLAAITAIPLGVLIGWKKTLYDYTEVLIDMLRSLPSVALIPIFLLFFGPTRTTLQAIIFWPIFFLQLIATIYGTQQINTDLIDSMRVLGMRDSRLFREVFLPGSLPGIVTGLRQTIATMLILTIVAEMLLASNGLGDFIMVTQRNFQVQETYAGVLSIGCIGYALNKVFLIVQRRVLFWSERQTI